MRFKSIHKSSKPLQDLSKLIIFSNSYQPVLKPDTTLECSKHPELTTKKNMFDVLTTDEKSKWIIEITKSFLLAYIKNYYDKSNNRMQLFKEIKNEFGEFAKNHKELADEDVLSASAKAFDEIENDLQKDIISSHPKTNIEKVIDQCVNKINA